MILQVFAFMRVTHNLLSPETQKHTFTQMKKGH